MGTVLAATQEDLGRRVAVKLLHPFLADRPDLLTRFHREALAAAALGHPNIVAVTDFRQDPGEPPFLVMEYLEGRTLKHAIAEQGTVSAERTVAIASQVLSALETAHAAGIVHRDLKPENVFLTDVAGVGEFVKVLDFGLAKTQTEADTLTASGALLGTPAYMAPEQIGAEAVSPATDLYALGATMYHALAGRLPFHGDNQYALIYAIMESRPPPLASLRPDLDPGLAAVVARAMARDPAQRFASAREMRQALSALRIGPPRSRTAPGLAPAAPVATTPPVLAAAPAGSGLRTLGKVFGYGTLAVAAFWLLLVPLMLLDDDNDAASAALGGVVLAFMFGLPGGLVTWMVRRADARDDLDARLLGFVHSRDAFSAAELAPTIGKTELETEQLLAALVHARRVGLLFHAADRRYFHPDRLTRAHQVVTRCQACGAGLGSEVVFAGEIRRCHYCGSPVAPA
jgi:serine/threonine-protein kinase